MTRLSKKRAEPRLYDAMRRALLEAGQSTAIASVVWGTVTKITGDPTCTFTENGTSTPQVGIRIMPPYVASEGDVAVGLRVGTDLFLVAGGAGAPIPTPPISPGPPNPVPPTPDANGLWAAVTYYGINVSPARGTPGAPGRALRILAGYDGEDWFAIGGDPSLLNDYDFGGGANFYCCPSFISTTDGTMWIVADGGSGNTFVKTSDGGKTFEIIDSTGTIVPSNGLKWFIDPPSGDVFVVGSDASGINVYPCGNPGPVTAENPNPFTEWAGAQPLMTWPSVVNEDVSLFRDDNGIYHLFWTSFGGEPGHTPWVSGTVYPVGTVISDPTITKAVTGATTGGEITCPGHGYTTGDSVLIAGIDGLVGAVGEWTITVVDANHFTVPTTFTGVYVSGGECIDVTLHPTLGGPTRIPAFRYILREPLADWTVSPYETGNSGWTPYGSYHMTAPELLGPYTLIDSNLWPDYEATTVVRTSTGYRVYIDPIGNVDTNIAYIDAASVEELCQTIVPGGNGWSGSLAPQGTTLDGESVSREGIEQNIKHGDFKPVGVAGTPEYNPVLANLLAEAMPFNNYFQMARFFDLGVIARVSGPVPAGTPVTSVTTTPILEPVGSGVTVRMPNGDDVVTSAPAAVGDTILHFASFTPTGSGWAHAGVIAAAGLLTEGYLQPIDNSPWYACGHWPFEPTHQGVIVPETGRYLVMVSAQDTATLPNLQCLIVKNGVAVPAIQTISGSTGAGASDTAQELTVAFVECQEGDYLNMQVRCDYAGAPAAEFSFSVARLDLINWPEPGSAAYFNGATASGYPTIGTGATPTVIPAVELLPALEEVGGWGFDSGTWNGTPVDGLVVPADSPGLYLVIASGEFEDERADADLTIDIVLNGNLENSGGNFHPLVQVSNQVGAGNTVQRTIALGLVQCIPGDAIGLTGIQDSGGTLPVNYTLQAHLIGAADLTPGAFLTTFPTGVLTPTAPGATQAGGALNLNSAAGSWAQGENGFAVPQAGRYCVLAGVESATAAIDNPDFAPLANMQCNITRNGEGIPGTVGTRPGTPLTGPTNKVQAAAAMGVFFCEEGDQIGVSGYQASGSPYTLNYSLQIMRLGDGIGTAAEAPNLAGLRFPEQLSRYPVTLAVLEDRPIPDLGDTITLLDVAPGTAGVVSAVKITIGGGPTSAGAILQNGRLQISYDNGTTWPFDAEIGTLLQTRLMETINGEASGWTRHLDVQHGPTAYTNWAMAGTLRLPIPFADGIIIRFYNPATVDTDSTIFTMIPWTPYPDASTLWEDYPKVRLRSTGVAFGASAGGDPANVVSGAHGFTLTAPDIPHNGGGGGELGPGQIGQMASLTGKGWVVGFALVQDPTGTDVSFLDPGWGVYIDGDTPPNPAGTTTTPTRATITPPDGQVYGTQVGSPRWQINGTEDGFGTCYYGQVWNPGGVGSQPWSMIVGNPAGVDDSSADFPDWSFLRLTDQ